MTKAEQKVTPLRAAKRAALGKPIPKEGEDGVFTQSWFAICLSDDLGKGEIAGKDFLGGRIVAYRGEDGVAQVLSAYCAHLGTDLALGKVFDNDIRCPFHMWRFDRGGRCLATGSGAPPPPAACLFDFPTIEAWGFVWAFNGEEALYELPKWEVPKGRSLVYRALVMEDDVSAEPWVLMTNTFDLEHLKQLHGVEFASDVKDSDIQVEDHVVYYDMAVAAPGKKASGIKVRQEVWGTNNLFQFGETMGRPSAIITPIGLPRPGYCHNNLIVATTVIDGDEADRQAAEEFLDFQIEIGHKFQAEDIDILKTMSFRSGALTRDCGGIALFLDYVRDYPRAHPSLEFIT